ncbi:MAG TPA: hypothetical protein VE547_02645, partial [Mycobacteriales bacterium]|nr:hypothetical protein [Mycobacteriales bacterium]
MFAIARFLLSRPARPWQDALKYTPATGGVRRGPAGPPRRSGGGLGARRGGRAVLHRAGAGLGA